MSRPSVLVMDTADDRKEAYTALLRHLPPARRADFLDWVCAFAKLTHPRGHLPPLSQLGPDYPAMAPKVLAASRGDAVADALLANEVYADVAGICHQWGTDFRSVCEELEQWARGREATPPRVAAARLLGRRGSAGPAAAPAPCRTAGTSGSARPGTGWPG